MQQVLTNEHIATMKINGGNKKKSPPKSGREPAEFKKSFQVMISLSDPDFDRRKEHRRIYYVQINIIKTEGDSQRPQMVGVHLCTLVCTECTQTTTKSSQPKLEKVVPWTP